MRPFYDVEAEAPDVTALQARNRARERNARLRILIFWCVAIAAGLAAGALIGALT